MNATMTMTMTMNDALTELLAERAVEYHPHEKPVVRYLYDARKAALFESRNAGGTWERSTLTLESFLDRCGPAGHWRTP